MDTISEFIRELKNHKNTSTVTNFYHVAGVAENLEAYLRIMLGMGEKRILLVGEAPGYKGCKITGIPFTSGKVFEKVEHPILLKMKDKLVLTRIEAENTATIVWNYLSTKTITPMFWNSFPFHPHPEGRENKNRPPTNDEVECGVICLRSLYRIFKPKLVAGIGNSGVDCARRAFPDQQIQYIRHPSFGGKSQFIKGMNEVI